MWKFIVWYVAAVVALMILYRTVPPFRRLAQKAAPAFAAVARLITWIWMALFYFIVIPFFTVIKLKDPLRTRLTPDPSYWQDRKSVPQTVDRHAHPF